ncbi:MAG: oligosaccharide repeat unit polymerase [Candidatus Thermoplasmatota archaeon]|nr:oligosaccharide repeat unit polymerase [Candidatus Thermoplasmatota archaeon]
MAGKKDSSRNDDSNLKKKLEESGKKSAKRRKITRDKSFKELEEKLEGTHKIERLKKFKKRLLIPQIIGIIVLFPFLMYFNGASFDPLYMPIYHSLLMLFGWILIIFIGSLIFKILRIKRHKSYSYKYLLARNSMRKSITLAVIALIIFGFLYNPYLTEMVNEFSSVEEKDIELNGENTGNFETEIELANIGLLGLRRLKNITFESVEDGTSSWINITLYQKGEKRSEGEFRNSSGDGYKETFDRLDTGTFKVWVLHVDSSSEDPSLEYTVRWEVFPNRQDSFSLLSFLYLGVFAQSAAILYPFKKRYAGKGIYR